MAQKLDLVIFGATGFTGKYTVEEVNRISKNYPDLKWGIAGRSQSKLERIIKDLQEKTGDDLSKIKVIIADVSDSESLTNMAKQAKVVINCCGPYRLYGEPVVKACIETQTHHVDVSGEPAYMERMQLEYNEAAEKAGVYIVSACGFDSIPADMGVIFLEQNFKGQVNAIETYLYTEVPPQYRRFGEASIHYGTWESLIYGIAQMSELAPLRRQLYPNSMPQMKPKIQSRGLIHRNHFDNTWCIPFLGSDKSVVYRTQRYLYDTDKKRPVQMNPYVSFSSIFLLLGTLLVGLMIGIMAKFSCGRKLLLNYPRLFSLGFISHEGPSELVMKNTKFWINIYGNGWDQNVKEIDGQSLNKSMKVKVTGYNPGYGATCTALIFSAITILKESDKMPGNGGVLPPGAAFGKTSLIENLNKNNLKFEVMEQTVKA